MSLRMAEVKFILLVLSVLHLLAKSLCLDDGFRNIDDHYRYWSHRMSECPSSARVNLTGEIPDEFGAVEKFGYVFPREFRRVENGEMFGCSCYVDTCLPLCCPFGMALMEDVCVEDQSTQADVPPFHSDVIKNLANVTNASIQNFHIFTSNTCNHTTHHVRTFEKIQEEWSLIDHAEIKYISYYNSAVETKVYGVKSYCLSRDVDSLNYRPTLCRAYRELRVTQLIMTVHDIRYSRTTIIVVTSLGMIISIPFLVITFIVYTLLPEMKNVHGLTLRGYVGCLAVGYTILAVVENNRPLRSKFLCHFSGFAIQFSFLASFFWLNVMCFDIWRTFGSLSSPQKSFPQRNRRKTLMYSVYVWGCAIFFTVVCVIMNYTPGIPKTLIRPEFGLRKYCWFKTNKAKALYFYGPMVVTILCNIFFFVSTALKIIRDKKDAAQHVEDADSERHDDSKQWFSLYAKLFIVIGINWFTELISWLCQGPEILWYITDLATAIQGVIIFVIFICKNKIWDSLMKRFRRQRATV